MQAINTLKKAAIGAAVAFAFNTGAFAASANYHYVAPTEWAHGDAGTLYAAWDNFSATTDTSPDVGSANIQSAEVKELTGGAFVTSGGNIYSFAVPTSFQVTLDGNSSGPATGSPVSVSLQLFTLGTLLDLTSVKLNGVAASGGITGQYDGGTGFGGQAYDAQYLFTWDIAATDLFSFTFNAVGSSMSLDTVAIDIGPSSVSEVPVPAAAWLFGSAVLGMAGIGRRRNKQPA